MGERYDETLRAEILEALKSLPVASHVHVFEELAAAASSHDAHGGESLSLFLRRLVVSTRVRRDPMFGKLLRQANDDVVPEPGRMTGSELIAALRG